MHRILDMVFNKAAVGRNTSEADSVAMRTIRADGEEEYEVDIRWNDGASVSVFFATGQEAVNYVNYLGWA